jgi:peroxiredoxin
MTLSIGSVAPDFELSDQHGNKVSLSSFKGKKNVVLLFYPFSFTGICTGELCAMRDDLSVFQNDSVELIAISCDSMFTQRVFADQEKYQFPVLSDFWPHGATAKAYGIFDEARGCAIRGTFIINKDGAIAWQVINAIGDARSLDDYKAALAAL